MSNSVCRVGVVGAGTVGGGVIDALLHRTDLLERRGGARIELTKVAEPDAAKPAALGVPAARVVSDYKALVAAPDVDVVVELIGGMGVAHDVVRSALEAGKPVVTANKALLAEKGKDLFALAKTKKLALAFEAAVCGGIPIILSLREGLIANRFASLLGIVNGTCNYILTEMIGKNVAYAEALKGAQALGYAEANPRFDVEGIDSGHKLALLSALALDTWIDFPRLHIEGVSRIDLMDLSFAQYLDYTVKLLAVARPDGNRLFLSVHPALLKKEHPLAGVQGSMNAVALHGDLVLESMFYGRGAGRTPTASAVVADIVAVARAFAGKTAMPVWAPDARPHFELAPMEEYRTRYYLRFMAEDRPGVMGRITTSLGERNVSIASVHQFESELKDNVVPISVLTHESREGDVRAALVEIARTNFLRGEPVFLRIEG